MNLNEEIKYLQENDYTVVKEGWFKKALGAGALAAGMAFAGGGHHNAHDVQSAFNDLEDGVSMCQDQNDCHIIQQGGNYKLDKNVEFDGEDQITGGHGDGENTFSWEYVDSKVANNGDIIVKVKADLGDYGGKATVMFSVKKDGSMSRMAKIFKGSTISKSSLADSNKDIECKRLVKILPDINGLAQQLAANTFEG